MEKKRNAHGILGEKPFGKQSFRRPWQWEVDGTD
jgi:hypothetical protein